MQRTKKTYLEIVDNSFITGPSSFTSMYVGNQPFSRSPASCEKSELSDENPTATAAMRLLNLAGARIIRKGCELSIGLWEDTDCAELRAAIRSVGMGSLPVVYLESAEVPLNYKVRSCPDRAPGESFAHWFKRAEVQASRKQQPEVQ